jgi:hypothetical protein
MIHMDMGIFRCPAAWTFPCLDLEPASLMSLDLGQMHAPMHAHKAIRYHTTSIHYRRAVIPRVPGTSPRAKNRALGEGCTRGRIALGEDGTRKRKGAFDGDTRRSRLKKN